MSIRTISSTIENALAAAGLNTRSGPANTALEAIRKALEAARIVPHPSGSNVAANGDVIDVDVIELPGQHVGRRPDVEPAVVEQPARQHGQFLGFSYSGPLGRRAYKLYVPASYDGNAAMPLVVMLHGCKQDPDDFAAGTRLNEVAEEQGFLVAYPAQSNNANGSNCWNWFQPQQQHRAGAEPSIIVGIVGQVSKSYRVDERSVFVAGLSAGAAMAVILGDAYPDVFAAVAAHSGLPHGAAQDVASAFAAMHGAGQPAAGAHEARPHAPAASAAVPTIVFHGDRDTTVVPRNGAAIAQGAASKLASERGALKRNVEQRFLNGRRCTCIRHVDGNGLTVAEQWIVHGGGHMWSGGSSAGSFADPQGVDASREMMRFFLDVARGSVQPRDART